MTGSRTNRLLRGTVAAGALVAGVQAAAAAEISVENRTGDVDFGLVTSTASPGEIAEETAEFRVTVDSEERGPFYFSIDFPTEITLEAPGVSDFATVAVDGPLTGETNPAGRGPGFELTLEVTTIPGIGGSYAGTLPVTVHLVTDP